MLLSVTTSSLLEEGSYQIEVNDLSGAWIDHGFKGGHLLCPGDGCLFSSVSVSCSVRSKVVKKQHKSSHFQLKI